MAVHPPYTPPYRPPYPPLQDTDRCPVCWLPVGAGEWATRSRHSTSLGEVEYCAGPCGCLVVLVDGQLVKTAADPAVPPCP